MSEATLLILPPQLFKKKKVISFLSSKVLCTRAVGWLGFAALGACQPWPQPGPFFRSLLATCQVMLGPKTSRTGRGTHHLLPSVLSTPRPSSSNCCQESFPIPGWIAALSPAHRLCSAYHTGIFLWWRWSSHCPEFWGGLLFFFPPGGFKAELWSPFLSPPPVSFTKNSYKPRHSDLTLNLLGCLNSLKSFILLRRPVSRIL